MVLTRDDLVATAVVAVVPARALASSTALCGTPGPAPAAIRHVVLVMLENASYRQVAGSPNAPFETGLASRCGVGSSYLGATHSSAANYLAISAGEFPA